jgi:hypothetical protein
MAAIVYYLCALTSLACAILLIRAYVERRVRLLLWSGICFIGLALNNALLIVDRVMMPERDLAIIRTLPALVGIMVLIYGLIWDAP